MHPHSQERARMNHLLRSNHPFTKGKERADNTTNNPCKEEVLIPGEKVKHIEMTNVRPQPPLSHLAKTKYKKKEMQGFIRHQPALPQSSIG